MFLRNLVSVDYDMILVVFIVIAILIAFIYASIVILSFFFMFLFKRKIKRGKEAINVIIFQKYDSLMKLEAIFDSYLDENSTLKLFAKNDELKKYNDLRAEDFDEAYKYTERILSHVQKAYIDIEILENKTLVKDLLLAISELNTKYLQAVQLYNTNVIGYNYWRDLFSTKRIKNILFIKKINTIN